MFLRQIFLIRHPDITKPEGTITIELSTDLAGHSILTDISENRIRQLLQELTDKIVGQISY
jgi:hypothetical protein